MGLRQWLQQPSHILWVPSGIKVSLFAWFLGQAKSLLMIYLVILGLLVLMKILNASGLTDILVTILKPILKFLGTGQQAIPITIIGMTIGLAYGGGLIIEDARSGKVSKQDVFFSLSPTGLSPGLIEDTLLMMLLGGHLSGILWRRLLFSLLCIGLLVRLLKNLPEPVLDRYFFRPR